MPHTTLISTNELANHLNDPNWVIVDCRLSLADTERGRRDYQRSHIPGAVYAHLDEDLSGPIISGKTGRHPLPDIDLFVQTLSRWGIDADVQVVVYDDSGGGIAARLWWMLRWLGHDAAALLDGGWPLWQSEERQTRAGIEKRAGRQFIPHLRPEMLMTVEDVTEALHDRDFKLFDSRTADRYRGENETIDPIAGHIPGAVSAPYPDNLGPDGLFRAPEELRTRFQQLLNGAPSEHVTFYCGSGVTAAHNVLAMVHAGFKQPRLYAGSWSEWITDRDRPIAVGNARHSAT